MKDNAMVQEINLLKLLKNKKDSEKLFTAIGKAYVEVTSEKIMTAINDGVVNGKTIEEIKAIKEQAWLPKVIHSVIQSSRAVINMEEQLKAILEGSKDFTGRFESGTKIDVTYNEEGGRGNFTKEINTEIILTADLGTEDIFRALRVAYYGGDYKIPAEFQGDDIKGPLYFKGDATYNPKLMEKASEKVRDFIVTNYEKDMYSKLNKDLQKELKDALSK